MTASDLGVPQLNGLDAVPRDGRRQTAKDYKSDQEVRWCPGCGDYAVLNAMQGFLPQLGLRRENIVFISGIGCSSRFPYYMNTYGMHSIHGRAPAIATGLAVARPDLSIWVVTGDGDALSIGGNHLIHTLRRNVNLKILLFNNRVYGLTKGQYSPTSAFGTISKSTPMGSVDRPFNPLSLALGAEASFVARAADYDRAALTEVLTRAARHRGSALVEIYQNCPVFNDGAFESIRDPSRSIRLTHGEPIRFGRDEEYGVVRGGLAGLRVARVADVGEAALVVHDAEEPDPCYPFALSRLSDEDGEYPVTGVLRDIARPAYDDLVRAQVRAAKHDNRAADLMTMLRGEDTWTVRDDEPDAPAVA
ncbi:MAG TPA: 2-oxoacid:ferredoxin oxidoreductase subunit beta [Pseudonocardiaceae bacterium]